MKAWITIIKNWFKQFNKCRNCSHKCHCECKCENTQATNESGISEICSCGECTCKYRYYW